MLENNSQIVELVKEIIIKDKSETIENIIKANKDGDLKALIVDMHGYNIF